MSGTTESTSITTTVTTTLNELPVKQLDSIKVLKISTIAKRGIKRSFEAPTLMIDNTKSPNTIQKYNCVSAVLDNNDNDADVKVSKQLKLEINSMSEKRMPIGGESDNRNPVIAMDTSSKTSDHYHQQSNNKIEELNDDEEDEHENDVDEENDNLVITSIGENDINGGGTITGVSTSGSADDYFGSLSPLKNTERDGAVMSVYGGQPCFGPEDDRDDHSRAGVITINSYMDGSTSSLTTSLSNMNSTCDNSMPQSSESVMECDGSDAVVAISSHKQQLSIRMEEEGDDDDDMNDQDNDEDLEDRLSLQTIDTLQLNNNITCINNSDNRNKDAQDENALDNNDIEEDADEADAVDEDEDGTVDEDLIEQNFADAENYILQSGELNQGANNPLAVTATGICLNCN